LAADREGVRRESGLKAGPGISAASNTPSPGAGRLVNGWEIEEATVWLAVLGLIGDVPRSTHNSPLRLSRAAVHE
jgi:hypothetical protein